MDGIERAMGAGGRVLRAAGADGRAVFVKHFGMEGVPFGCRLHALASACLPAGIWSASPPVDTRGRMDREMRKAAAFREAGIAVPDIRAAGPEALASSDAGPDIQALAKRRRAAGDTEGHDALLLSLAGSLAQIHSAGLCHGRPHLRDAALGQDGVVVWFDFEEEPEAAMPLADAQARDLWLLFFQICQRALDPRTPARALEFYHAGAPRAVSDRLCAHLRLFAWVLPAARLALRLHDGGDLRRFVEATRFLAEALRVPQVASAQADEETGDLWAEGDGLAARRAA